jgi:magnesium chelatase family protein
VLFLDEATEFPTRVLDALRQPLEHGEITLARAGGITSYPARVQLVLAANPCPCGASDERECVCSQATRRRYLGRLSGPLMDRIDIQIDVAPVNPAALFDAASEPSALIAQRVLAARAAARARWGEARWSLNAQVPGALLRGRFRLPGATTEPLDRAVAVGELSARGYDRVLRLAWSLADLAGVASPTRAHVQRALALRVRRPQ